MSAQGEANRSAAPFRVTLGCMPKQTMNPNGVALPLPLKVRATPLGFLRFYFHLKPRVTRILANARNRFTLG